MSDSLNSIDAARQRLLLLLARAWTVIALGWLAVILWSWFRGAQITQHFFGWHVFIAGFGLLVPYRQQVFIALTPLVWIAGVVVTGAWVAYRTPRGLVTDESSPLEMNAGVVIGTKDTPGQTLWQRLRFPVFSWATIAVSLGALQTVDRFVKDGRLSNIVNVWMNYTSGLNGFDGPEYLNIARRGYEQRQLVWFPLYPALIRVGRWLGLTAPTAAVLITLTASLCAACLFWLWLERRIPDSSARSFAWLALMIYPYSWYLYGVIYSDALFLCLVLAACVLLDRDRLMLGGIAGALAAAARPSGLMFCVAWVLLILDSAGSLALPSPGMGWAQRWRFPLRVRTGTLRSRHLLAAVLPFFGWLAYVGYLWVRWDSPLAYVLEQERYHGSSARIVLKQQFFEAFSSGLFDFRHLATTSAQALILLVVLGSVAPVGRRFGWGYAALVLGFAVMPAVSVSTLMGVGRYLIPCFPAFALFGEWLYRRHLGWVWFPISIVALAVMMVGFSRSWYLS